MKILGFRPEKGVAKVSLGIQPMVFDKLLSAIGISLPRKEYDFFSHAVPSKNMGYGFLEFQSPAGLFAENLELLPGAMLSKHGYFAFACDGDGSSYSLSVETGTVIRMEVGRVFHEGIRNCFTEKAYSAFTHENIRSHASHQWPSLRELFLWALDRRQKWEASKGIPQ